MYVEMLKDWNRLSKGAKVPVTVIGVGAANDLVLRGLAKHVEGDANVEKSTVADNKREGGDSTAERTGDDSGDESTPKRQRKQRRS
jgi:hypothetical protein